MSALIISRKCPICQIELFYSNKKHLNTANKIKSLCRNCAINKRIHTPKEEFVCIICKTKWYDWRSQISNPTAPTCSKKCWQQNRIKNLIGKRFGNLLVIERERRHQTTFYKCQCDCGNSTEVTHSNLISGSTSSCGCLLLNKRKYERKPLKEVISNAIFSYYKRNARKRHYEWDLSYDRFYELINENCFYCNSTLSNVFTWRYKYEVASLPFNGIDRVDNTIGYTLENCVSCCRTCNSAKGELSLKEFKEWSLRLSSKLETIKI